MVEITQAQADFLNAQLAQQAAEEQGRLQNEADFTAFQAQRKTADLERMAAVGLSGEPNLAEYKLFFNKPEWFGANWETLATEEYNKASSKIDVLLDWFRRYYP
jgi:hypothetical protein